MDHREFSGILPRKLRDPLGIIPRCVMISMVASMRTHYGAVQRCLWSPFLLSEETLCWFAWPGVIAFQQIIPVMLILGN
jgi:hypothetical protein